MILLRKRAREAGVTRGEMEETSQLDNQQDKKDAVIALIIAHERENEKGAAAAAALEQAVGQAAEAVCSPCMMDHVVARIRLHSPVRL